MELKVSIRCIYSNYSLNVMPNRFEPKITDSNPHKHSTKIRLFSVRIGWALNLMYNYCISLFERIF